MARCAIAGRTTNVPTTVRGPNVYATAAVRPQIRKIEVYNTAATQCAIGVARATATGTKGSAITAVCISDDSHTVVATGAQTHTADATVSATIVQASLGATIGSGIIWTWGPGEFVLDKATTAGVVIICPTGTGQNIDFSIEWEE